MAGLAIAFGWTLSKLPESFCKWFCWVLGALFYLIPSKRKTIIFSNLHHAFPEKDRAWLKSNVWKISERTAEMGLFTIVCPHFSEKRFKQCFHASQAMEASMQEMTSRGRPVVFFSVHFSMIEAFNAWPAIANFNFPEMAIMYRPYKDKKIDALIKNHRERFGLKLVSRKAGIRAIGEVLRNNGCAAVLFDQNTRDNGTLIPFFDRVTSATELPEMITKKYKAIPAALMCSNDGFWRGKVYLEALDTEANAGNLTLTSNQWLEKKICEDESLLVDWLWSHNRWKILHRPHERLGMKHKRKGFDFQKVTARKMRIALFLTHLDDKYSNLTKFTKALRQSRPDAALYLFGHHVSKQPDEIGVDGYSEIDYSRAGAKEIEWLFFDLALVLEDDRNLQAWVKKTKIQQRYGVVLDGKRNAYLSEVWAPENLDTWEADPDWVEFGKRFGLEVDS